jgi:HAD superfamily hydrolase (TIGR01509 family)
LKALGVHDAEWQAVAYAGRKQERLEALIDAGGVTAFADALRFVRGLRASGWPIAAASSSKNANAMMQRIYFARGQSLLEAFDANVCGRTLLQGKPNPEIFILAAKELRVSPARCLVVEDAPAGIEAARAGRMAALGVARRGDADTLWAAGANLVVASLDEIAIGELSQGRLSSSWDGATNYGRSTDADR